LIGEHDCALPIQNGELGRQKIKGLKWVHGMNRHTVVSVHGLVCRYQDIINGTATKSINSDPCEQKRLEGVRRPSEILAWASIALERCVPNVATTFGGAISGRALRRSTGHRLPAQLALPGRPSV